MIKDLLLAITSPGKTEPQLRKNAEEIRKLPMLMNLSDEDFERAFEIAAETLEISLGKSYLIEETKHKSWFGNYYKELKHTRWDRYTDYLTKIKKFGSNVVQEMQENLFKITDLLGNPNAGNFARKGLVVGDVQSGKTANYVGLMNLAADAKYKLIIVLTGTTNTLREQTQIRIEEGLGMSKIREGVKAISNVEYGDIIDPIYLTTREKDFNRPSSDVFGGGIDSTTVPIVIVTKKNSSALKNILKWLTNYSQKENHNMIDNSLLLIDDEADFASVNTKDDEDPTSINKKIREILGLFTRSSYIGFTATPYANIFINPDTDEDMEKQDLFPKDYIYVLGESNKYVGIQSIYSDDPEIAKNSFMLVPIDASKVEDYLPLKHKKTQIFTTMPPSMKEAVNLFLLANIIRDLRGDSDTHRTMLINASRFVNMHKQLKSVVGEYVESIKKEVRLYGKLPLDQALQYPKIKTLKISFDRSYSSLSETFSFEKILLNANDSIFNIRTEIVNAIDKGVDYQGAEEKEEKERVIVIGGFALSRGLTLEGLIISYYWRNSTMYDSLLQMGRWFGFRPNYEDLCRVFMTHDVISDYKFIGLATAELKNDLARNSKKGLTPKQFGIRVRTGQAGLIITARNKMKTGMKLTAQAAFSKDVIETTSFSITNTDLNQRNAKLIHDLISSNQSNISKDMNMRSGKEVLGLKDVPKTDIIEFLNSFTSVVGSSFDSSLIVDWLNINEVPQLDKWDVIFVNGDSEQEYDYSMGISGTASERSVFVPTSAVEFGIVKNNRSRLASSGDGHFGLSKEQLNIIKEIQLEYKPKSIPQKEYFRSALHRKPVILIFSVLPKITDNKELEEKTKNMQPVPLLSIGIPELDGKKTRYINYTVNKIYQAENVEDEREE